jgi:hypothetical protein
MSDIQKQLSSQCGDKTEESNRKVAALCVADSSLLGEIVAGLAVKDVKLVGDAAEVLTMVAQTNPELVAPHADALRPLLNHKATRPRWEACHALALVARLAPRTVEAELAHFHQMIRADESVIVRDYSVTCVGNYAGVDEKAAEKAYTILREALVLWDSKQASRALEGLGIVANKLPKRASEIRRLAESFQNDKRAVVKQAARKVIKELPKA